MDVNVFIKNWIDELRSSVNTGVKAGKRKPTIAIVCLDSKADEEFIKTCEDVGFIGEVYEVPTEEISQKDLFWKVLDIDTDGVYVQEPLPEGYSNPLDMEKFAATGIKVYLDANGVDPRMQNLTIAVAAEGYNVMCAGITLEKEVIDKLSRIALLENAVKEWEDEN